MTPSNAIICITPTNMTLLTTSYHFPFHPQALSDVLMISNLPMGITDDQVKELVSPFGTLKAFNSIKTSTSQSGM